MILRCDVGVLFLMYLVAVSNPVEGDICLFFFPLPSFSFQRSLRDELVLPSFLGDLEAPHIFVARSFDGPSSFAFS